MRESSFLLGRKQQQHVNSGKTCLTARAKALAPLMSQTTKTYVSSPQLDSPKPTYLPLPSPLQKSAQIVQ
eukprot:6239934-Ditylum_brightwellii.AAC.1